MKSDTDRYGRNWFWFRIEVDLENPLFQQDWTMSLIAIATIKLLREKFIDSIILKNSMSRTARKKLLFNTFRLFLLGYLKSWAF